MPVTVLGRSMMSASRVLGVVFALLMAGQGIFPASAAADEALLTLPDALAQARHISLRARQEAALARAAADERQQVAVRANPEITLGVDNVLGTGPYAGAGSAETTLSIHQTFDRSRAGRLAVSDAMARERADQVEQRLGQLDVDVINAYYGVLASSHRLDLAEESERDARALQDDIEQRYKLAVATVADRNRAGLLVAKSHRDVASAHVAWRAARRGLISLLSVDQRLAPTDAPSLEDTLFNVPVISDDAAIERALAGSLTFRILADNEQVLSAELDQERLLRRVPVTAGVGVRRFSENGDGALVGELSIPIPIHDRNTAGIRAAQGRLEAQQAEADDARREATLRALTLADQLRKLGDDLTSLQKDAIPLARQSVGEVISGFGRGRYSWADVMTARQQVMDAEEEQITVAVEFHALYAELDALLAGDVTRDQHPGAGK